MFRSPKTYNEMKHNSDPETKEFIRKKRNPGNLPNLFDDIKRSDMNIKNWKKIKKRKQWQ